MELDFFFKLKYQSSTKLLSVGIKSSVRDLCVYTLWRLYARPAKTATCVIYGQWCQRSLSAGTSSP